MVLIGVARYWLPLSLTLRFATLFAADRASLTRSSASVFVSHPLDSLDLPWTVEGLAIQSIC